MLGIRKEYQLMLVYLFIKVITEKKYLYQKFFSKKLLNSYSDIYYFHYVLYLNDFLGYLIS